MNCETLSQLQYMDFDIRIIDITTITRLAHFSIDYRIVPRKQNQLLLITEGSSIYEYGNQNFTAETNSIVLLPDNASYFCESTTRTSHIGIWFDLYCTDNEKIHIKPELYHSWINSGIQHIKLFHEINQCYSSPNFSIMKTKTLVYQLLSSLISDTINTSNYMKAIEPAIHFIATNYYKNLPISIYAKQCNLSESYFRKKFRECVGMSPIEYRNKIRFREAQRLFKENYSVTEIADMVGFCDVNYFTKLYKRSIGASLTKQ